MRKIIILAIIVSVAMMPMAFANICDSVHSPRYLEATGSKFVRGLGNVLFSWVELFRQPIINENKWEGVGRGFLQTGVRAVAGALEVVTAIVPGANIPQPNPPCPTDLVNTSTIHDSVSATSVKHSTTSLV